MFFSIVIPVYNREEIIKRAINSCLNQIFRDFEIIVVDDASTDKTVEVVRQNYESEQNLKIIVNSKNMGVCPTRQNGIDHAKGRWIIFLDSDNELFPNALETMKKCIDTLDSDIKQAGFIYKYDTDNYPDSYYENVTKGRCDWMEFIKEDTGKNKTIKNEGPLCFHIDVFRTLRYSYDNLRMNEVEFTFDFMHNFCSYNFGDIVGMYYTDAGNRLSMKFDTPLNALSLAISTENLLKKYGQDLKKYGPKRYKEINRSLVYYNLISKKRRDKITSVKRYLKIYPHEYKIIFALLLSLISVKLLFLADKARMVLVNWLNK